MVGGVEVGRGVGGVAGWRKFGMLVCFNQTCKTFVIVESALMLKKSVRLRS